MTFDGGNKIQFFQFPCSSFSAKSLFRKFKTDASVLIYNNVVLFTRELESDGYCKNAQSIFFTHK